MKKICFATCMLAAAYAGAQPDTLIGAADGQLIKISQDDAGIASYQVVASLPAGATVIKLSWAYVDQCFYSCHTPGAVSNQVSKIDASGNYSVVGTVTVGGIPVDHIESLCYDERTQMLYVAASLNGTVPSDYWSETLLLVDRVSLVGTVIGTFSHPGTVYEPEADNLVILDENYFFYTETEGGGSPFFRIYKQDISMSADPVLIYEDLSGGNGNDITIKDGYLYFCINRVLRRIDLSDNTHSIVGTMFTSADFSGQQLGGLDYISDGLSVIPAFAGPEVHISPNPSPGLVQVTVSDIQPDLIAVYDLRGQLVQSLVPKSNSTAIDLGHHPGIYLLHISIGEQIVTRQIVIE